VTITRNGMRHPMPADGKQQKQKALNSYSAVILEFPFSVSLCGFF
jgi:hypothetical protein